MDKFKCPYCGGRFLARTTIIPDEDEIERELRRELIQYLHGQQPHKGYIERVDGEKDAYRFELQLYDSPEGDTWVSGIVRWHPRGELQIEELKSWQM
ncbi:MAG: hypothetical protein BAA01_09320 [Bacillus thermozeamaize]|uniref:Uncharacterized protein n=1 Tax=Bacillus thermozeamaize TaxID=230954 RepID=A0A1Y3PE90_9BACI|nr:MAG: hypothetical protein BAA01_09320 [Bacillus thermozeamaize]